MDLITGAMARDASDWSVIRVLNPEFDRPVGGQSERFETVHRPLGLCEYGFTLTTGASTPFYTAISLTKPNFGTRVASYTPQKKKCSLD